MPTAGGFDHMSGFNHPTDADFLALEDIVYGYTRRNEFDSDDDSEGGNPWLRCRPNSSLKCPVCKKDHAYAAPGNGKVSAENRYSHDARVVFASFGCPICLEDPAGPPMVVLPCGHAICQDDFRLLGGKTTDAEADAHARQVATEVTQQHQESISRNHPAPFSGVNPFLRLGRDDMDQVTMAMMHAFASSLNEAMASTGNGNNSNIELNDSDEESTDSEMPELMHRQILSESSTDEDGPDDPDSPHLHSFSTTRFSTNTRTLFPPSDMFGGSILGGSSDGRPPSDEEESDEGNDSSSAEAETSDDGDSDEEESSNAHRDEVIRRLREYHLGNLAAGQPTNTRLPKLGQWLLVPEIGDNNTVNLIYYCAHQEEINLVVSKRFPRGTRTIPNGRHGVYVYTPPVHFYRNGGRRQWPRNDDMWEVYYVKNSKPANDRPSRRRRRRRQELGQVLNTTVSDPQLRYKLPRRAQLVADGKGGIWALIAISSLPQALMEQVPLSEADSGAFSDNESYSGGRQRSQPCRLVHYTLQGREGVIVGGLFPSTCKLFMDQTGGVIVLRPHSEPSSGSSSTSSSSCLWHVSDQPNHPQTLLYGGLPSHTKVVGDSSGSSVFLLSSGGRLQSILTRVRVDHSGPVTATEDAPSVRSSTCFSYDLDVAMEAIQDIVDVAEGHDDQVFLHARMRDVNLTNPNQTFRWKLCLLSPRTEAVGERNVNLVDLDVDCPRTSRIVSDREKGVWVWKKPFLWNSHGDRSFVHVQATLDGQEQWNSRRVFPPRTQLAALG